MRQRAFALLALLFVALPASAGFVYEFKGFVTDDNSAVFAPGTPISGTLYWSPENASGGGSSYSGVFRYDYMIGGETFNGGGFAFTSRPDSAGGMQAVAPRDWTGPGSLEEVGFSPVSFVLDSLDMDLSGIWATYGFNVFRAPGEPAIGDTWHGHLYMSRVPEPGTLALSIGALFVLLLARRRRTYRELRN
jgi:hypothetical protein